MRSYSRPPGPPGLQLPQLSPSLKRVLLALGGLYVVELLLPVLGVSTSALMWQPLGQGFAPWQLFTRFLINKPAGAFGLAINLLMLYFVLPDLMRSLSRRQLLEATGAAALGATALPLLFDLVGLGYGAAWGWGTFLIGVFTLFGLLHHNAIIRLYFLFPIKAGWFVWISLGISLVSALSSFSPGMGFRMQALQGVGVWVGTWGWWQAMGPGVRKRKLVSSAKKVERDLKRFTVLDGGRDGTKGGKKDVWH